MTGQTQLFEGPNSIPIQVDFVLPESVARGYGVRMVVVVPAFAERQKRDPPIVRGSIARHKAA